MIRGDGFSKEQRVFWKFEGKDVLCFNPNVNLLPNKSQILFLLFVIDQFYKDLQ
jgi:hypothetical protein